MSIPAAGQELRSAFETILADYPNARANDQIGKDHALWQLFASIASTLQEQTPVQDHPDVSVEWSVGSGNWADVPWIAFLDARETTSTQSGVYPALLFREDASGFYLTLAQGVTEPKKTRGGWAGAEIFLRGQAEQLRERVLPLQAEGFTPGGEVDLSPDPGLG